MQQLICAKCAAVIAATQLDVRPHTWPDDALCPTCLAARDLALRSTP